MTPNQLQWNTPVQLDVLKTYQVSREFYQEIQYRQEFDRYCQWYHQAAERHRQELQKMRRDLNILSWFRRYPA